MERTRRLEVTEGLTEDGPTLDEIVAQAKREKVPGTARLSYQGCGSHWVAWHWRERLTPEEEDRAFAEAAAERLRIEAEEADDRRAGF